ncbi:MAG: hypothetical protein ACXVB9_05555 [Bdellovibrionota bacterium]
MRLSLLLLFACGSSTCQAETYDACWQRLLLACRHACDGYDPTNCRSEMHIKVCAPQREECLKLKEDEENSRLKQDLSPQSDSQMNESD